MLLREHKRVTLGSNMSNFLLRMHLSRLIFGTNPLILGLTVSSWDNTRGVLLRFHSEHIFHIMNSRWHQKRTSMPDLDAKRNGSTNRPGHTTFLRTTLITTM